MSVLFYAFYFLFLFKMNANAFAFLFKNSYPFTLIKANVNVDAKNIAINGKVSGNVYVYGLLQLGSEAFIKGDIYYKSIEMEVGAKIDGRLVICSKDEEIDLHKIDIESISNSNTINNN